MHKFTVCILRVSTVKQNTDLQRNALREEILRRNLTLLELDKFQSNIKYWEQQPNICVLCEDKISGRHEKRPEYLWAIGQVKAGHVAAVITYRADRLGRSVQGNLAFADACIAAKTELFSLKDKVDITSASGKLVYNVLSAAAQYQSDIYSENTKEAIAAKREKARAKFYDAHGREPTKEELNELYRHGGTSKGWLHKSTLKKLDRFWQLVDLGWTNYEIVESMGINYRSARKWRALPRDCKHLTRAEMNKIVYGKSSAVI